MTLGAAIRGLLVRLNPERVRVCMGSFVEEPNLSVAVCRCGQRFLVDAFSRRIPVHEDPALPLAAPSVWRFPDGLSPWIAPSWKFGVLVRNDSFGLAAFLCCLGRAADGYKVEFEVLALGHLAARDAPRFSGIVTAPSVEQGIADAQRRVADILALALSGRAPAVLGQSEVGLE